MRRGELWWADLGQRTGSEPAGQRLVVLVQADSITSTRFETVLAVPCTSNLLRAQAIGNVLLPADHTGLPRDTVAIVTHLTPVGKEHLLRRIGQVDPEVLGQIEIGILIALELA